MTYDRDGNVVRRAARMLREEADSYRPSAELPWRLHRTPYRVFLAEFLLVRTRSDVVARVFEQIFSRYPAVSALAEAHQGDLRDALRPLGLPKRVPYLLRAARYLMEQHDGEIPRTVEELMQVPGLGLYTAVAIAAFAYGSAEVPADVNVLRLLSRLTGMPMSHPTRGSNELRALLPHVSRDVGGPEAEDLLDFSRLVCRPRRPLCEECPLTPYCDYRARHQRRGVGS